MPLLNTDRIEFRKTVCLTEGLKCNRRSVHSCSMNDFASLPFLVVQHGRVWLCHLLVVQQGHLWLFPLLNSIHPQVHKACADSSPPAR